MPIGMLTSLCTMARRLTLSLSLVVSVVFGVGALLQLAACSTPPADTEDGGANTGDGMGGACGSGCGMNQICESGACRDLPATCPCPKMSFCEVVSNTCKAGCLDDTQCGTGQYCDTAARTCKNGCNKDAMCSNGDICVDHACRPGCRSSSACPGSVCNMTTFQCDCTLLSQLYCATDKKCTTHDGKLPICDVKGAKTRGSGCTGSGGVDDCAAGLYCKPEGMAGALCRQFCNGNADCGGNGSFCDIPLASGTSLSVCSQPCTGTFPGSGCPTDLACLVRGAEHTNCQVAGASAEGGTCVEADDCKSGLTCITAMAGGAKCRRVCPKGNATFCGTGNKCYDISTGTYNWVTYGACCPTAGC